MKRFIQLFMFLILSAGMHPAVQADDDTADLPVRVLDYTVGYRVHHNGACDETRRFALKILKKNAVEQAKQYSISYSTSLQKAEVLEAYTEKPDGRRLDVPKANFQVETNTGTGKNQPVFSDWTTLTVVFPDVEVGDTVVFSYRLSASEPIFPGQFSTAETFNRTAAFDHVKVTLDAPTSLWLQYRARSMKETASQDKDRRVVEWTYENPRPAKSKRFDYSAYDTEQEPGVDISTFHSYAEIAAAYGARATPKAKPTAQIRQLADKIAGDRQKPADVARALYEWVATNITYAGNCIGLGSVVPRDMDFVIDNRIGDCKDHATLLQALLAAKGIASSQVLINAGTEYHLPAVPVVSMVNHVINYIPSLNLFLDSTSDATPFGMLPFSDQDKPVLLVTDYQEGLKTPVDRIGSNSQAMTSTLKVLPDGSVDGDVNVALTGRFAASMRARMRELKKDVQEDLVKNMFKRMGFAAQGEFRKEDPKALLDTYRYGATFKVDKLIQFPGTAGFVITPYLFANAPIAGFIRGALQSDEHVEQWTCSNAKSTEDYTYVLPAAMKVLAIPDDLTVENSFLRYEATYSLKDNVLKVHRVLDDRTVGNLCTRKQAEEYRAFANKVLANLKSQVVYR